MDTSKSKKEASVSIYAKIELNVAWTELSITNYKTRIHNDYLTAYQHSMQSLQENDKFSI